MNFSQGILNGYVSKHAENKRRKSAVGRGLEKKMKKNIIAVISLVVLTTCIITVALAPNRPIFMGDRIMVTPLGDDYTLYLNHGVIEAYKGFIKVDSYPLSTPDSLCDRCAKHKEFPCAMFSENGEEYHLALVGNTLCAH